MTATDLKVRVGFLFDEKSLNALSKRLQRSGEQLSRIGTDLTLSLSAPLAAFGAASIKAAGDIESLTLALKSQLGSSEAAAAELDKLTEAAKNPGLGVEQAVRGSVRLQGVGLAAEEARETLIQMGNAIAATGGTAQELDNVTRQFAQMISKGRVLQEDVSILSENMPGLAQLMQKAFGTQSVEAIREMGVGGKEFVQRITEAAKELPRVEGGIKNGIGNAMDSLKQSAAKVGLAINTAFDVTGLIESFSGGLLAAANAFASLDSGVQKLILSLAGIVIATGPVVSAFGAIKQFAGTFVSIWANVLSSVKAGITAFKALDTAMKLTVIGGLIAAVGLLAAAYTHFSSQLTDAERAQKSLSEVNRKAAESVAGQKSEVDTLVAAYKSEGATLDQKKAILSELNRISPEYFGGIRVGKGDIEAITAATAKYSAELIRVAKATAYKDRLVEIEKELLNLNKTAQPSIIQSVGNAILSLGNVSGFAAKQAQTAADNIVEQTKALEAERTALSQNLTQLTLADAANNKLNDSTKDLTDTTGAYDEALRQAEAKASAYKEVLVDIQAESDRQSLLGVTDLPQKL
jgi:tape measure domain-containing protein